jgi:integrase
MSKTFTILTRSNMRQLQAGDKLQEHGIIFTRLPNGNGRFSVCITVDGQRIHRVIGTETDGTTREQAWEFINRSRIKAKEQRLNLPKGRKTYLRFQEAANRYLERMVTDKDIKHKSRRLRLHLLPFFRSFSLNRISTLDVETYKQKRLKQPLKGRRKGLTSKASINRELAVLSHLLNRAVDWGWLDKLPCQIKKFSEEKGRIDYLTREEIRALLAAAAEDSNRHIYPYIFIALHTGMRHSEILSLRKEDIDCQKLIIYIKQAKAGAREQPMSGELAAFLEAFIANLESEYLFPSERSSTGHLQEIRKPFTRVVKRAGLDETRVVRHTLRHTVITHLVQAGVDLPTVKRISGHRTLSMVERYAHQNSDHIQAAFSRLHHQVG